MHLKGKARGKSAGCGFFVLEEISELKSAKRGEASVLRLLSIQLISAFIHMPKTPYLQQSSCPMLFLGGLSILFSLTNPLDVSPLLPSDFMIVKDCLKISSASPHIILFYHYRNFVFTNNPYNPPILALQKPLLHNYSFYETRGAYPPDAFPGGSCNCSSILSLKEGQLNGNSGM